MASYEDALNQIESTKAQANNAMTGANTSAASAAGGAATGTLSGTAQAQSGAAATAAAPTSADAPNYTQDAINQIYDAQMANYLNQLETSYNQNLAEAELAKSRIGGTYQDRLNALSNEYERTRHNTNEYMNANGMNTGTGSQAALAQRSEYQRDYANIGKSEAEAMATAEQGIQNIKNQYQSDVNAALATNDYERATALLSEYKDNYNRQLAQAETMAAYGDFSGYSSLYGEQTAINMANAWYAQNPDLAYMAGRITQAQRENLIAGKPINDGLDAAGNRVSGSSSGNSGGGYDWTYNDGWADAKAKADVFINTPSGTVNKTGAAQAYAAGEIPSNVYSYIMGK